MSLKARLTRLERKPRHGEGGPDVVVWFPVPEAETPERGSGAGGDPFEETQEQRIQRLERLNRDAVSRRRPCVRYFDGESPE